MLPETKQRGSSEILDAIEKHISTLGLIACMRLLFDIATLQDIRNQWSTNADANLKKIATRFKIDTTVIAKDIRAKAKTPAAKAVKTETKKGADEGPLPCPMYPNQRPSRPLA